MLPKFQNFSKIHRPILKIRMLQCQKIVHLCTRQGKIDYIQPSITSGGIAFRVLKLSGSVEEYKMLLISKISRKYIDEF